MQENQKCGECIHWLISKDQPNQGQCRQSSPQLISLTVTEKTPVMGAGGIIQGTQPRIVNKVQAMFPPMLAEDVGCSKFFNLTEGTASAYIYENTIEVSSEH